MNIPVNYTEAATELVDECKKGSDTAFRNLYLLYSKAMFSISIRILNNREEAEDVLQESFISAFKKIRQYDSKASFGSWLKRIVINRSLDTLKKRKLNFVPLDDTDLAEEESFAEDNIEYDAEAIKKAIQQLPDGYRIVLTLYLFEDYSHKQIAEELNISEGTSKSQYSRARKKLIELITLKEITYER